MVQILVLYSALFVLQSQAQLPWIALGTQTSILKDTYPPRNKKLCRSKYFHSHQKEVCKNYTDLIPGVALGIKLGLEECQIQFRNRQWNCTVEGNVFTPIVAKASRESAFISAITSAGVAYSITESCAEGKSVHCRCDTSIGGTTAEGWRWGGCNRPIAYGIWFARLFIDKEERLTRRKRDPRRIMNLHNNRAGREIIRHNLRKQCKCHGLSGNCNLQTCWLSQPDFSKIGNTLKEHYDSAHEMVFEYKMKNRSKRFRKLVPKYKEYLPPTKLDFVYYEESPNYCLNNRTLGIAGTRGRICNISSSGVDGCGLMCCRRGYKVEIVQKTESCGCNFVWCCKVRCRLCTYSVPEYRCK